MEFLGKILATLTVSSFLDDESIFYLLCGDSPSLQIESLKLLLPHVHTIFLLQETRGTMLLSTPDSHLTPPGPDL